MEITHRLMFATATALGLPSVVHANAALIARAPTAPMTAWVDAPGRSRFSFDAHDATLRGFRYGAPRETHATLLFFNGSGNTVRGEEARYRALAAQGVDVVAVDYRGYGFSTGTPDMEAFARDGLALYDMLSAHSPVIVYGYSLGTAIATQVAEQREVAGLVLAAPIASAAEEVAAYLAASRPPAAASDAVTIAPDAHTAFDEAAHVAHLRAPLLVVHGTADTNVPIAQGREVFAAAGTAHKTFVELPGIGHGGIVDAPVSLAALRTMLHGFASGEAR